MNIKLSPFQATQALFSAYHRQRLFARSFKSQTPDLMKEKSKKKEKFDISALARWFVSNRQILRRRDSSAPRGKLEQRRKTEKEVKELDFEEAQDLFRCRTKSSFEIQDQADNSSFMGRIAPIKGRNKGHKQSSIFNASSISSGIVFYPKRQGGGRQFESIDSRDDTMKVDGTSIGAASAQNMRKKALPRLIESQKNAYLTNIQICLDELEQSASPKSKLAEKKKQKLKPLFGATVERMMKLSGERGIRGSFEAKERLKQKREKESAQRKRIMKDFIKADTNIVRSLRLKNLLEEKWHQTPNGYRILTRLTPRKQDRVHKLLGYDSRKIK